MQLRVILGLACKLDLQKNRGPKPLLRLRAHSAPLRHWLRHGQISGKCSHSATNPTVQGLKIMLLILDNMMEKI